MDIHNFGGKFTFVFELTGGSVQTEDVADVVRVLDTLKEDPDVTATMIELEVRDKYRSLV